MYSSQQFDDLIKWYLSPVPGRVRLSLAHLVTHVRTTLPGAPSEAIATINPKAYRKGEVRWQAFGGAATLSAYGVQQLMHKFQAADFEFDNSTGLRDARFSVPGDVLIDVVDYLLRARVGIIEQTPHREFFGEVNTFKVLIKPEEKTQVHFNWLGVAIQPPATVDSDTSLRGRSPSVPTRRVFMCWEVQLPVDLFKRLVESEYVRICTPWELALTQGGKTGSIVPDGTLISNNLGVPICRFDRPNS